MTRTPLTPARTLSFVLLCAVGVTVCLLDYPDRGFGFRSTSGEPAEAEKGVAYDLVEIGQAVGLLSEHYAFQSRLEPKRMLAAALQGIEGSFDYIIVRPPLDLDDTTAEADLPDKVEIRIRNQVGEFDISKVKDLYQMTWKLMEIFDFFAPDDELTKKMEEAAIDGMLSVLDPHTTYLNEAGYKELKMSTRGSFGGLGIVISVRKGRLLIISVMPGTPAAKEGLKKGDHIVRIDKESTVNMIVSDAASRLRGKPGSSVDVWLLRDGFEKPRRYQVTRETIKVSSVLARDLDGLNAYVMVKNFQQNTATQVAGFLDSTYQAAPPTGVILDLRGNSGGVMSAAVELADLFLGKGNVVTSVERVRDGNKTDISEDGDRYENCGLVVLVDHASASASEIVTGALKYRDRAVVLGTRTFGKGSVQYINPLSRGALKLTVAQYVGPGMEVIQSAGVEPHIELRAVRTKGPLRLPSFADEFEGEGALPYHLQDTGAVTVSETPLHYLRYVPEAKGESEDGTEEEKAEDLTYDEIDVDFAVRLAWSLLVNHSHERASQMLDHSGGLLEDTARHQEERLAGLALTEGKSWEPVPSFTTSKFAMTATASPEILAASEEGTLEFKTTNLGPGAAPRLYIRTESEGYRFDGKSCVVGTLEPGQEGGCEVGFTIPATAPARKDRVHVDLMTGLDETLASTSTTVSTAASPLPRLALSYRIDDSAGNGDGALQVGEKVQVILHITNLGDGVLAKGLATLKNNSGAALFLEKGRVDIEDLGPGLTQTVILSMTVQSAPEGKAWEFSLGVVDLDSRTHFYTAQAFPLLESDEKPVIESSFVTATHDQVWVYIAPHPDAPRFGFVDADGGIQSDVSLEGWYRLQLPGRRVGWGRRKDLRESRRGPMAGFVETYVAVEPEVVASSRKPAELMGTAKEISVAGTIDFGLGHAPGEAGLSVYRNGQKVQMVYYGELERGESKVPFDLEIALEPGVNRLLFTAFQKNQSPGYLSLYYNREN